MEYGRLWLIPAILILLLLAAQPGITSERAEECNWPQFHGPRRDNLSDDTGLLKQWPEGGPGLLWKTEGIGDGFSSMIMVDGTIYTAGNIENITVITALDMSGGIVWQTKSGPAFTKSYPGSRASVTFSDGKLYHLNGKGYMICLDATTGEKLWMLNILEKFGGRNHCQKF